MGRAQPAGRESWALCAYYWPLCTTRKAPPPQGMLGCYDLFLGAECIPNGTPSSPARQAWLAQLAKPTAFGSQTLPRSTSEPCEKGNTMITIPAVTRGEYSQNRWTLLILYLRNRCPWFFGFALVLIVKIFSQGTSYSWSVAFRGQPESPLGLEADLPYVHFSYHSHLGF